jgi:hypothetical protein
MVADPKRVYWASKSGLDLAADADRRVERYYNGLERSAMYQRWSRAYRVYYGLAGQEDPFDISKAGQAGDRGQLTSIKINHAGSLARQTIALISQTVPDFEPIPTSNSDFASLEQVDFTRRVLRYFMDTRGVGQHLYDTAQTAAIFGMGLMVPEWDPLAGAKLKEPVALPGGKGVRTKTGDLIFNVFGPLDMVFNRFRHDQNHAWFITRRFVNRFDLAARYPSYQSTIIDFRPSRRLLAVPTNSLDSEREERDSETENDEIPLYTLFHKRTDALPDGKYAQFLGPDILLFEGNLQYEHVPAIVVSPNKILRTAYGESSLHHVMGMQDTFDNVASSIATNNVAAGTQIIAVPAETDYTIDNILEGLAVIRFNAGPEGKAVPIALNLTAPNAEGLRYLDLIRREMETITGVSATMRGAPQPNVQSGSFGALLAQQALTYQNAFQYSFQTAVGLTGDLIISILKRYADQGILIEIVGRDRSYEVRDVKSESFSAIHRVTVKSGNPAARTPEFNQAMAEKLLERGLIKSPKDFITMVRTGDLDTLVDQQEAELMTIRQENEQLAGGKNPPVLATDDHRLHILRNKQPLDSPAARMDGKVAKAVLDHIQAHINALKEVDPSLLEALGQTPMARPQPQAPEPPGPPGAPPVPVPPPPGPVQLPAPPELPNNPTTGQRWSAQDGALPQ